MLASRPIRRAFSLGLMTAISLTASALDPHTPLQHYGYQAWQTDDGLPQNTIHAVLQARDGYMWFATEAGLVRFDGAQFTVFNKENTPQFGGNLINDLKEDKQGALWISTSDGLIRWQDGQFHTFTMTDGLPANMVWSVHAGSDGTLWALTSSGLGRYEHGRFQPVPVAAGLSSTSMAVDEPDGSLWLSATSGVLHIDPRHPARVAAALSGEQVQAIARDAGGRIWIGSHSGLKIFSASGPPVVFHLPEELGSDVTALLCGSTGHIWIGTANGLGDFDGRNTVVYSARSGLSGLPQSRITGLYEDREKTIWALTDRGIARVAGGHVTAFTAKEGLSGNAILSIYEDREGSLWLGTESGGVGVLRDRKFITYTSQDGLTDDLVRSVFQSRSGAVWIGTNGGGVDQFANGRFSSLTTANHLSSNVALALADDAHGGMWIGTPDGLNHVQKGRTSILTSADGLADDFVRSLYVDRSGVLWIGTRRGLSSYQNGKFVTYSSTDGLGSDLVGAVTEDADGSLWIGTLGGLTHFADGRFVNYTTQQGLSSNVITALHRSQDGTLWIGTNGGGLNARRDGRISSFASRAANLPKNIYGILEDAGGNLWLSSNKGIYRLSRRQLQQLKDGSGVVTADAYGTADGMRISECSSGGHPSAWKAQDGTLWFATLRGVSMIDPAHMNINNVPPLVAIEQVSVDDTILPIGKNLEIAPGHRRFAFQYAGLSFVAPQKVHFRYKLDGFDRDWIDAGTRRVAYYTNIPPGRHVFRVMACNNDGIWSETGVALSFRLRPLFYQTYWFYLLLLLSAGLLAYAAYRWRVRSVESRFSAVLAERSRIAREIHDTLAQGFVAVSVQLEVVSRQLETSGEAAREHLEQARILTRDCLAEARSSIWNLRSQGANGNDLATSLTDAAERITANSGVKARVQVNGVYRPIDSQVEAELLRIGQEAMTNVVRHAEAEHVDVTLLFQEKTLCMTIQDDGRGFERNPESFGRNGHFGITGMRERAEQIDGRFSIESAAGRGTQVRVEVSI